MYSCHVLEPCNHSISSPGLSWREEICCSSPKTCTKHLLPSCFTTALSWKSQSSCMLTRCCTFAPSCAARSLHSPEVPFFGRMQAAMTCDQSRLMNFCNFAAHAALTLLECGRLHCISRHVCVIFNPVGYRQLIHSTCVKAAEFHEGLTTCCQGSRQRWICLRHPGRSSLACLPSSLPVKMIRSTPSARRVMHRSLQRYSAHDVHRSMMHTAQAHSSVLSKVLSSVLSTSCSLSQMYCRISRQESPMTI